MSTYVWEAGARAVEQPDFTLRQGIEAILRKEITEIQVLDVTDHAAGMNPYYQPAKKSDSCRCNFTSLLFGATHPGRSVTGLPVARGKAAFAPPSASPVKRAVMLE
jgi:hypothetical protein